MVTWVGQLWRLWWVLVLAAAGGYAEVYTALVDLEEVHNTESTLLTQLQAFISAQERRLEALRRHYSEFAREHEEASRDVNAYLSNPINAYLLVKRLAVDWKAVESHMTDNDGDGEVMKKVIGGGSELKYPSEEDLNGAAEALLRLQETYNLSTAAVARGELNGVQCSRALSASDCFEIGRQAFSAAAPRRGANVYTTQWLEEALRRCEAEAEASKTASKALILEYLAYTAYTRKDLVRAVQLTDEILDLEPDNPRAAANRLVFAEELEQRHILPETDRGVTRLDANNEEREEQSSETNAQYMALCRGEESALLPPKEQARLHCRYSDRGSPYLCLMPVKEEEVLLDPAMLVFHGVLSDADIIHMQRLALRQLRRSAVYDPTGGPATPKPFRISKSATVPDGADPIIHRINGRIEAITGLTMATAESLHVTNYGIGGHYELHYDFHTMWEERDPFEKLGTGNRISTVLFYMTDVAQGGATAFPQLGVAVRPRKGSAVFWHNLKRNGDGDYRTRHAACPVLLGSKWVANKWIHEKGQEIRRPCGLSADE